MSSDDPFFTAPADDRTIIRPVPGGKRADIQTPPPTPPRAPSASQGNQALPTLGGLNPLEKASSGLLALLTRINGSQQQTNSAALKNKIIQEIQKFEVTADNSGIDTQTISSARYVMCTVLDEAVLGTPWGHNSDWSQHSLLSQFHKEVSGGDRFFQLLKSLAQNPSKNKGLLELMYVCLALGFEGRYRIVEGGKDKLLGIREWLFNIIQQETGSAEYALSPHWEGVTDQRNPLTRFIPLWVFAAVAAALLAALFSIFLFQLNNDSDPAFRQLLSIKTPVIERAVEPEPVYAEAPAITLSLLLASEIEQDQLKVSELVQRSIVTLKGDSLFASGSTTVNREIIPLLHKIAAALNQLPGEVLVTGHSDNVPIRSSRYPSNWHLSKARAESVAKIVKQNLQDADRTLIEGRSDLDPIASNKTSQGRAKNRRVEVTLLK
ncbi:MAG: type VI secretion system protein TssL [Methyloprofundus sp.]|nr:type VI secretion system protein TssL [Methyloprofundus sp.]